MRKPTAENIGVLLNGDFGNASISWGNALYFYANLLKKLKWFRLLQELNQYSRNVGGARLRNLPIITRIAFPNIDRFVSIKQIESFPKMINSDFAQKTGVFEKLNHYGMDQSGWVAATDLNEQRRWTYENIFPTNASNTLYSKLSLKYNIWKRDPTNDLELFVFVSLSLMNNM